MRVVLGTEMDLLFTSSSGVPAGASRTASFERQRRSEAVSSEDARALPEPPLPDRGWPELNDFTRSEDADDVANGGRTRRLTRNGSSKTGAAMVPGF